jgi:hypothetical protein
MVLRKVGKIETRPLELMFADRPAIKKGNELLI